MLLEQELDNRIREMARKEKWQIPEGYEERIRKKTAEIFLQEEGQKNLRNRFVPAVAAVALTAAGWATLFAVTHNQIVLFDSEQELLSNQNAAAEEKVQGYASYEGADYHGDAEGSIRNWWNNTDGILVSEKQKADGQAGMRIWERENDGELQYRTLYWGDSVSELKEYCPVELWEASWLEQQYESVPDSHACVTDVSVSEGTLKGVNVLCKYLGDGGTEFIMSYHYNADADRGRTVYNLTGRYDDTEVYETADGAQVVIEEAVSENGQQRFWAKYEASVSSFSISGVNMEREELHELLDRLELAGLDRS